MGTNDIKEFGKVEMEMEKEKKKNKTSKPHARALVFARLPPAHGFRVW